MIADSQNNTSIMEDINSQIGEMKGGVVNIVIITETEIIMMEMNALELY